MKGRSSLPFFKAPYRDGSIVERSVLLLGMTSPDNYIAVMSDHQLTSIRNRLRNCTCCPRDCAVDRTSGELGYCRSGAGLTVGAICSHRGEEPVISGTRGVCNIFFTRCNMQCICCQNYDISRTGGSIVETTLHLEELVDRVERHLNAGCKSVGFVSPSHFHPQVVQIVHALRDRGLAPVYVYNSNGYEKAATLRELSGLIDVYLPDFKYRDEQLARELSDAPDYPEVAAAAIREMYRQKGADIDLDQDGLITSGLIIRHLVLPGAVENSKAVLRYIAEVLSTDCYLSLMSQYCPVPPVADHPALRRHLRPDEYEEVLDELDRLGFHRGWSQHMDSPEHYRPRFMREHPFEE